jgi:GGDEF domain-containing protein
VTPTLYLATLGPISEVFGLLVVIAVFALLRAQADRRAYFTTWEKAWVFLATGLVAGVLYERFIDPESIFYPISPATSYAVAAIYLGARAAALAMVVTGVQLFVRGSATPWLMMAAAPAGLVLAWMTDTQHTPLAALALLHGPVAAVAFAYAAVAFNTLPASRHSLGTRAAAMGFMGLAVLGATLAVFYALQRSGAPITAAPWAVRYARYGFYSELLLNLFVAWAMVRILVEDGRRENDDARARMKLLQDREHMADMYDTRTMLLGRRAFDAKVGLEFARASFGSVVRLQVTNYSRIAGDHSPAVAEALLTHLAGVLDGSVRTHDRVYRWGQDELLVVMPRAIPKVARARVEFTMGRTAPMATQGMPKGLVAEAAVTVEAYRGAEDLADAAEAASHH